MASSASIVTSCSVTDAAGVVQVTLDVNSSIADVVGQNGKRETVSLTGAAFTALSPPTGSTLALINIVTAPATSATLKGVTGDTGIILCGATVPAGPILIPLGTSPSIGIAVAGASAVTAEILWL